MIDKMDGEEINQKENSELAQVQEYVQAHILAVEGEEKEDPHMWKLMTGLDEDALSCIIESVVFMSDRPVPLQKIKNIIDKKIPLRVYYECIQRLQEGLELPYHGIRLVEVAEGYQFRTRPNCAKYIKDMVKVSTTTLGPTAMEVLAIIAYKQPISKSELDKIRGVDSNHIIRGLMDKRLVAISGRSEDELGRPTLYTTTHEFLEVFNLKNLQSLPPEHELESMLTSEGVGEISDIRSLLKGAAEERYANDDLEELDELAQKIKSISAETEFTKIMWGRDQEGQGVGAGLSPRKTAFELLEEHLIKQEIMRENLQASQSWLEDISPMVYKFTHPDQSATFELFAPQLLSQGDDQEEKREEKSYLHSFKQLKLGHKRPEWDLEDEKLEQDWEKEDDGNRVFDSDAKNLKKFDDAEVF